jgi:hypothetical protein
MERNAHGLASAIDAKPTHDVGSAPAADKPNLEVCS